MQLCDILRRIIVMGYFVPALLLCIYLLTGCADCGREPRLCVQPDISDYDNIKRDYLWYMLNISDYDNIKRDRILDVMPMKGSGNHQSA